MTVHMSNLAAALEVAIKAQREIEKVKFNYTQDSCLVAGWEATLRAIENGESLEFF